MPDRLRVFISSPGDVPDERLQAGLVIDKLQQDYGRFFSFEPYRWEYEPMLASGHFQDVIEPPSAFDIVVLILWSRLGTPLPPKTPKREYCGFDGRTPVTGTEWEYEEALQAAQTRGAPDILTFRNVSPTSIDPRDPEAQSRRLAQLTALNDFWRRHFADRGTFLAAYSEYMTLEDFSSKLEQSLRKLIERRIKSLSGPQQAAPLWPGVPFRGLQSYEFEHAAIFFGRDGLVAKAAEQLAGQARAGTAFLLVSGASGSGKSSLVKAALLPRLMKPQRIEGIAFLRRVVFRPSDGGQDVIHGLAEALLKGAVAEGVGLPELLAPGQQLSDLVGYLRSAPATPGYAFASALGHVTEAGRASGRLLAHEQAKLILVIDQLEELFTIEGISPDDRRLFIHLLAGLARSGVVWVLATMRADFRHRAAELPELISLTEEHGRIEVAPPSPAELAEMIRKPAQAAGLSFEIHGESNLGLDAVLAEHAAAEPGVLPLLSFTLETLYAEDVKRGGRVLSFASYDTLGGLEGAIATRADEVVGRLEPAAQATLPRVLRALATVVGPEQTPVARAAPLASFAEGSPARALVDVLIAARLLVAASEKTVPTVRLAHEALLSHWQRAREQLAADRRDLETRALIERQQARWSTASGRAGKQLLLRDPDLANAIDLRRRWGSELAPELTSFIALSDAAAKAVIRRRWAVAAVVMLSLMALAAASVAALYIAETQRNNSLIAQSRFLARDAHIATAQGNAVLGGLLALAALPHNLAVSDRPAVMDAEYALEDAIANRRERLVIQQDERFWTASFSPDSARFITGNEGFARLWDTKTGAQIKSFGHPGSVHAAVFSPDGNRIVTASSHAGTVYLWNAKTDVKIRAFVGHGGPVGSAAFSPDGTRIVTASADKTARIWNVESGALIRTLTHPGRVRWAAFSPDGTLVVTASEDQIARVWDVETGAELSRLKHSNVITSASFSRDGTRIVTSSLGGAVLIWNARTSTIAAVLKGHEDNVLTAAFSPDGSQVVTASADKTARLWNGYNGAQIAVLRGHEGYVESATFSPDGKLVVTTSIDKTARLWDVNPAGQIVLRSKAWNGNAAFSPDGTRVIAQVNAGRTEDNGAWIWDIHKTDPLAVLQHTHILHAVFSPDGKRAATTSVDKTARIWNVVTSAVILTLVGHEDRVVWAEFSPDGTLIATASWDQTARVWDAQTGAQRMVVRGHNAKIHSVTFSPDGKRILTAGDDKTARVWDATTGEQLAIFGGDTTDASDVEDRMILVQSASFSPDGKRVAIAALGATSMWNIITGTKIGIFRQESVVTTAAFSRDGKRLATSSWDGTLRVWDIDTEVEALNLRGHADFATSVAFSPDDQYLVSASHDGTVRIWTLPPRCQGLIDVAPELLPRSLLDADRAQYFLQEQPKTRPVAIYNRIRPFLAHLLPAVGETCR
jgi:WD40 repeat protein